MKNRNLLSMSLFAAMLALAWGTGFADGALTGPAHEDGYTINMDMPASTGDLRESESVSAAHDEAIGTGTLSVGSDLKLEWPVGFDARPGIDGP